MSSAWTLLFLLIVPGLMGLVLLVSWLETFLTYQLVPDDVAVAWETAVSADELEQRVGRIVERVIVKPR